MNLQNEKMISNCSRKYMGNYFFQQLLRCCCFKKGLQRCSFLRKKRPLYLIHEHVRKCERIAKSMAISPDVIVSLYEPHLGVATLSP